ncbi:hypothetical protein ABLN64_07125, partial [Mycobacterium tuberculosis]
MAVKASREFVIDAPPEVVMEALADVGVLASWSPLHKQVEVIDYYLKKQRTKNAKAFHDKCEKTHTSMEVVLVKHLLLITETKC